MKKYEFEKELKDRILPFWMKLIDPEHGGSYGTVDYHLELHKESPKGGVVSARHLWAYSGAYLLTKEEKYLRAAEHSYQFLTNVLWDKENDGIYWLVDYLGQPLISSKHIYAQSFAIYGLSEFFKASNQEQALKYAIHLYELLEQKCFSKSMAGITKNSPPLGNKRIMNCLMKVLSPFLQQTAICTYWRRIRIYTASGRIKSS